MKRIKDVLSRWVRPGMMWTIVLVIFAVGLTVFTLSRERTDTPLTYISYGISAYALVVLIVAATNGGRRMSFIIRQNPLISRYLSDARLRARISLYQGLFINSLFAVFHVLASWIYTSLWFAAVASYHIILSFMRFLLLRSEQMKSKLETDEEKIAHELQRYRLTGRLLFALNIAMVGMMVQMIEKNKGIHSLGLAIYAFALYAFYNLTVAIINMVKFRKMDRPLLSAAKMLSVAGALMSILALQSAMMTQFGEDPLLRRYMNSITGTSVSLTVIAMAVFMVVRAKRALKKLQLNHSET
ncbi:hypothetical protein [Paenibacillus antibioticophila]|uniref:hypothetical protein n=1 Tax=Paenibacillus antibioticophila TaxID=1274374 RepID=UPI0005C921B9|nr:hypothetical protein [Paenibacillus antibioticophila]